MGLSNSPDIFQEKMSELFYNLEFVRAYLDDLLVLTNTGGFDTHIDQLEQVLKILEVAGLKVNASKSFFAREELEYLGYWLTRDGIKPLAKKVEAILNIAHPKTRKQLLSFIGRISYYRDMWIRRSDTLAPPIALTSSKVTWKWTDIEQTAFDAIKQLLTPSKR
jgi:hypothetical protein